MIDENALRSPTFTRFSDVTPQRRPVAGAMPTAVDIVVEEPEPELSEEIRALPVFFPGLSGCRSVEEFQCINRIEEGTYGVVYRAKEKRTGASACTIVSHDCSYNTCNCR